MAGLMDIAPPFDTVNVGEQSITVHGVSIEGLAYLLRKFPELAALFTGGSLGDLNYDTVLARVPGAVVAIIACGCGMPGDDAAEKHVNTFGVQVQADLFTKIVALTMPDGMVPFVERLEKLASIVGADTGTGRSPKSRKQPKS